jgi:hypothetical protein
LKSKLKIIGEFGHILGIVQKPWLGFYEGHLEKKKKKKKNFKKGNIKFWMVVVIKKSIKLQKMNLERKIK